MQAVRRVGAAPSTRSGPVRDLRSAVDLLAEKIRVLIEDEQCDWIEYAQRAPASELTRTRVFETVERSGEPLVFEGCISQEDTSLFAPEWLLNHYGDQDLGPSVRNVDTLQDYNGWTHKKYITEYLMKSPNARKENLYARDVPVPQEWSDWFLKHYEPYFAYASGDLLGRLPKNLIPLCLMAYVGCEGNRTPAHIDVMGAVGHNLMTYAEPDAYAIWFVGTTSTRPGVEKYLLSKGQHLMHDSCVLSLDDLRASGVKWKVVIQREGDFVFVPPDSCHQVINGGGQTVKVAWNRFTPFSLRNSIHNVLPKYSMFLKGETYRTKTIVETVVRQNVDRAQSGVWTRSIQTELQYLVPTLEEILHGETIEPAMLQQLRIQYPEVTLWAPTEYEPDKHSRTCNFCACDLWQRWYHCPNCPDDFDLCLGCVAARRGCVHGHSLVLHEFDRQSSIVALLKEAKAILSAKGVAALPTAIDPSRWSVASVAFRQVHFNGKHETVACHSCRKKVQRRTATTCDGPQCGRSFCHSCLFHKNGILPQEASLQKAWICPVCTLSCLCGDHACAKVCIRRSRISARSIVTRRLSSFVPSGPLLDMWYNRPPPLRKCFGPGYSSLKLLGVSDSLAASPQQPPPEILPVAADDEEEASECSDDDTCTRISEGLLESYEVSWMPGLDQKRRALARQFFGVQLQSLEPVTARKARTTTKAPAKRTRRRKSTEVVEPSERPAAARAARLAKRKRARKQDDDTFAIPSTTAPDPWATRRRTRLEKQKLNSIWTSPMVVIDDDDDVATEADLKAPPAKRQKKQPSTDASQMDDSSTTMHPVPSEEPVFLPPRPVEAVPNQNPNSDEAMLLSDDEDEDIEIEAEDGTKWSGKKSGEPEVVRPILDRLKMSTFKSLGSHAPTLVSGIGFVTSLTCPPWPVALLASQQGNNLVDVKLLGLSEIVRVGKSSLHTATSMTHIRELQKLCGGRGPTPDFASAAPDWSMIKRYYTKGLDEALAILMRLQQVTARLEKETGSKVGPEVEIVVEMY